MKIKRSKHSQSSLYQENIVKLFKGWSKTDFPSISFHKHIYLCFESSVIKAKTFSLEGHDFADSEAEVSDVVGSNGSSFLVNSLLKMHGVAQPV